ncbi:arylformamidase [Solibacillus sp. MA9]|uniref:Kynurenine formamidase n=1 Tax=Solibacillus palustris TaxID=2908203 RepID=A0ABS9UBW9_9BACL|nr:arylformamidase [Solibacillus sp. MA9]
MWIDITQTMKKGMPNWPGDTPFSFEIAYTKQQTGSVNIGKIETSLHTGTHADAPFHFDNNGPTIDQLDVNTFIGDCLVIDCRPHSIISAAFLQAIDFQGVQRILLKTVDRISDCFPQHIPIIDAEVAALLKERGVFLLGVDNPSVDSLTSKEVQAHHALYAHQIQIIEGLDLSCIEPGLYDFIALPLKIEGADGAPVRAVIRKK